MGAFPTFPVAIIKCSLCLELDMFNIPGFVAAMFLTVWFLHEIATFENL